MVWSSFCYKKIVLWTKIHKLYRDLKPDLAKVEMQFKY